MKYLKLYESFYTDTKKLEDDLEVLQQKEYDLKLEYLEFIDKFFHKYAKDNSKVNRDGKSKTLQMNYKAFPDETLIELYCDKYEAIFAVIDYKGKMHDIWLGDNVDTKISVLGLVMDAIHENYPEYTEGEAMGFFSLKEAQEQKKKNPLTTQQKDAEERNKQRQREEDRKVKPAPIKVYIEEKLLKNEQGEVQPEAQSIVQQIESLGYKVDRISVDKQQYAGPLNVLIDNNSEELNRWRKSGGSGITFGPHTLSEFARIIKIARAQVKYHI